jgi:hypothetical protein
MDDADNLSLIYKKIKDLFFISLTSIVLVLFLIILMHLLKARMRLPVRLIDFWGIVLTTLSVISGIAAPILLRIVFQVRTLKTKKQVGMELFINLQKVLILIPLFASFCANLAYLFLLPRQYLYTTILAALYGIYSCRPSKQKLAIELRYYGLDN